jgi:acetate kinase
MAKAILTINAGSSSIKFSIQRVDEYNNISLAFKGQIEGIGSFPRLVVKDNNQVVKDEKFTTTLNHHQSLTILLDWIDHHLDSELIGVGHRVVHGGPDRSEPCIITDEILTELEQFTALAPLHQPHNLAPVRAISAIRQGLQQVVCFDTAFHTTVPAVATRFAIPRKYEEDGIRRYGFHGLSYEYVSKKLKEISPSSYNGRVIIAHLGNGSSACAIRNGKSLETSMGFTALDGLIMGSRCGVIDAGVVLHLMQHYNLTHVELEKLLYKESGLLGISGISSDVRTLLTSDDIKAKEAIESFAFRASKEIAGLMCSINGLDTLVFTAGIGENAPQIREAICNRLKWMGLLLNSTSNSKNELFINNEMSKVTVMVIPTDEEAMIATHTKSLLS